MSSQLAPSSSLAPIRAALPLGLPDAAALFAFAADAERRVATLRLRIEEQGQSATGPTTTEIELLVARPHARVTTRKADGSYELWATDGSAIEGYNSATKTATRRPHRAAPTGLTEPGIPAASRVPTSLGPLPARGWATTFLRPSSFCTTVLAGAVLGSVEARLIAGRAALTLEAAAPRTVELSGDRSDFRYRVAFDRATGILLCVEEFRGETLMRSACVTAVGIDEQIPASEFTIELPAGTIPLY
jgi:hypothetical protein